MTKRTAEILKRLDETYGTEYICYLNHETPWQLLIAVILSAQCTDARVNIVTCESAPEPLQVEHWLHRLCTGRRFNFL